MYYSADTIETVIQGMREGVRGHMIGLLLVLLPNIQWIYLKEYSKGANAFAQAVQMILQSYSMNNMPNPKVWKNYPLYIFIAQSSTTDQKML